MEQDCGVSAYRGVKKQARPIVTNSRTGFYTR